MDSLKIFPDKQHLAQAVAQATISSLAQAIQKYGHATWVLAGGTTPEAAYRIIAQNYLGTVDWPHVTILIGDERIAPLTSPDSNWHIAEQILLHALPAATLLRPRSNQTAEDAADDYSRQLAQLPLTANGYPRLDVVWLGMGEDGHTLSLFPGHPDSYATGLVVPVRNSPKPPSERITLTFEALHGAQTTYILAAGQGKAAVIQQAIRSPMSQLPIAKAAHITRAEWYLDIPAASLL